MVSCVGSRDQFQRWIGYDPDLLFFRCVSTPEWHPACTCDKLRLTVVSEDRSFHALDFVTAGVVYLMSSDTNQRRAARNSWHGIGMSSLHIDEKIILRAGSFVQRKGHRPL